MSSFCENEIFNFLRFEHLYILIDEKFDFLVVGTKFTLYPFENDSTMPSARFLSAFCGLQMQMCAA